MEALCTPHGPLAAYGTSTPSSGVAHAGPWRAAACLRTHARLLGCRNMQPIQLGPSRGMATATQQQQQQEEDSHQQHSHGRHGLHSTHEDQAPGSTSSSNSHYNGAGAGGKGPAGKPGSTSGAKLGRSRSIHNAASRALKHGVRSHLVEFEVLPEEAVRRFEAYQVRQIDTWKD
jgi:hypothetical protein